jgi:hypothetical protein
MNTPVGFSQNGGGDGKKKPSKSTRVGNTGLTLYEGGVEKTPTGMSNAFSETGLTSDMLMQYASQYGLPTTSNRDFQEAQIALLQSTPQGQQKLQEMYETYGIPKAGTFADNLLGARTMSLMQGVKDVSQMRDEQRRLAGLTKRFVTTPEGKVYSFGQDAAGFDQYVKTKQLGAGAKEISEKDMQALKKMYPKLFPNNE